jgi:uncharacterized protein YjbI with pentapeptide repeats
VYYLYLLLPVIEQAAINPQPVAILPEFFDGKRRACSATQTRCRYVERLAEKSRARIDLRDAKLSQIKLNKANLTDGILSGAALRGADLTGADLSRANLVGADLRAADLYHAGLVAADLREADLREANLTRAYLQLANLTNAKLGGANLTSAGLYETIFANTDLSRAIGLDKLRHYGPSIANLQTLQQSGRLPINFLRGVGMPERLIDYLPSLFDEAIRHYSCFISYSTTDQDFADRLHSDLQNHGIRCWFASNDMSVGGKILDEIDAAIRLRDKLLLILSEHSIKSDWVETEVTTAFEEELKRGQTVLFPIRLDDAVMDTKEAWAAKLRARHIGDFRYWKDHDAYKKSFDRVVRDLTIAL